MEADYTDTYTATIRHVHRMTARDLFQLMFAYYPNPIFHPSFPCLDLQRASETGSTNLGESKHKHRKVRL